MILSPSRAAASTGPVRPLGKRGIRGAHAVCRHTPAGSLAADTEQPIPPETGGIYP